MSLVIDILIPGPVIMRAWVVWPLFSASKTYLPGLNALLDRAMWKSVSTAFTLVVLVAAEAAATGSTVAAAVGPAATASPASDMEAIRVMTLCMECMEILCG